MQALQTGNHNDRHKAVCQMWQGQINNPFSALDKHPGPSPAEMQKMRECLQQRPESAGQNQTRKIHRRSDFARILDGPRIVEQVGYSTEAIDV
jgi:hypothetical protein